MAEIRTGTRIITAPFKSGLAQMKSATKAWAKDIRKTISGQFAAAFSAGLLLNGVKNLFQEAGNIADQADIAGVAASQLQALGKVADKNAGSLKGVSDAFGKLNEATDRSLRGDKERTRAFEEMGISIDDLQSKSPEELYYMMADGVANATDKTTAYANLVVLLGDGVARLNMNMLNLGSEGLKQATEKTGAWSEGTIRSMAKVNVQLSEVMDAFKLFGGRVIMSVIKGWQLLVSVVAGPVLAAWELLRGTVMAVFKALTMDWKGAANEIVSATDKATNAIAASLETAEEYQKELKDLWSNHANDRKNNDNEAAAAERRNQRVMLAGLEEEKKQREELAKLREKVADEQQKQAFEQMSLEEKIEELARRRLELQAQVNEETVDGLNAKLEQLKVEDQLRNLIEKRNRDEEKEREKNERDRRKRIEAGASIAADSLARIGGGGNVAAGASVDILSENRKQTSLLRSIEQKVGKEIDLKLK